MTVKETGKVLNDGLHEIYVNTVCNDGSRIARLMAHFQETEVNDPEFPNYSRKMYSLKHDPKEVERVCKLVQDYAEKEKRRALYSLIQKGRLSIENAVEELYMSEAEVLEEMKVEGFKIPVSA